MVETAAELVPEAAPAPVETAEEAPAKPKRTRRKKADAETVVETPVETAPQADVEPEAQPATAAAEADASASPRRGWWQRTFGE